MRLTDLLCGNTWRLNFLTSHGVTTGKTHNDSPKSLGLYHLEPCWDFPGHHYLAETRCDAYGSYPEFNIMHLPKSPNQGNINQIILGAAHLKRESPGISDD